MVGPQRILLGWFAAARIRSFVSSSGFSKEDWKPFLDGLPQADRARLLPPGKRSCFE
jgi:hypothetical protein